MKHIQKACRGRAQLPGGFQHWSSYIALLYRNLGAHHIFNSPHDLRTATVVVTLFINKTQ